MMTVRRPESVDAELPPPSDPDGLADPPQHDASNGACSSSSPTLPGSPHKALTVTLRFKVHPDRCLLQAPKGWGMPADQTAALEKHVMAYTMRCIAPKSVIPKQEPQEYKQLSDDIHISNEDEDEDDDDDEFIGPSSAPTSPTIFSQGQLPSGLPDNDLDEDLSDVEMDQDVSGSDEAEDMVPSEYVRHAIHALTLSFHGKDYVWKVLFSRLGGLPQNPCAKILGSLIGKLTKGQQRKRFPYGAKSSKGPGSCPSWWPSEELVWWSPARMPGQEKKAAIAYIFLIPWFDKSAARRIMKEINESSRKKNVRATKCVSWHDVISSALKGVDLKTGYHRSRNDPSESGPLQKKDNTTPEELGERRALVDELLGVADQAEKVAYDYCDTSTRMLLRPVPESLQRMMYGCGRKKTGYGRRDFKGGPSKWAGARKRSAVSMSDDSDDPQPTPSTAGGVEESSKAKKTRTQQVPSPSVPLHPTGRETDGSVTSQASDSHTVGADVEDFPTSGQAFEDTYMEETPTEPDTDGLADPSSFEAIQRQPAAFDPNFFHTTDTFGPTAYDSFEQIADPTLTSTQSDMMMNSVDNSFTSSIQNNVSPTMSQDHSFVGQAGDSSTYPYRSFVDNYVDGPGPVHCERWGAEHPPEAAPDDHRANEVIPGLDDGSFNGFDVKHQLIETGEMIDVRPSVETPDEAPPPSSGGDPIGSPQSISTSNTLPGGPCLYPKASQHMYVIPEHAYANRPFERGGSDVLNGVWMGLDELKNQRVGFCHCGACQQRWGLDTEAGQQDVNIGSLTYPDLGGSSSSGAGGLLLD